MQTLNQSYRAIELLLAFNWDRLMFPGAILAALLCATYVLATFGAI